MSELRPPLHQPPNPDDLRRSPPATPACAHVRGLLRDFADNDLQAIERTLVEEHVHMCFACSVELSRAEHEVLRLRRGFASMAAGSPLGAGPAADFARRVVDRIVDETPAYGGSGSNSGSNSGSGDGAWGIADGQQAGPVAPGLDPLARGDAAGVRSGARRRSAFLVAAAALLIACFGALAMWSTGLEREPSASARLVVMRAKGVFGTGGRLAIGDGLGEAQWLQVGAGGNALFDWHDLSSGSQPAATLEMNGRGRLRLQRGAPLLMDGTIAIETNRTVEIPVADGSTIQLGIGNYVIAADVVVGADEYPDPMRYPLLSAPPDLRIRIEVLRGEPARILGTEVGPTLVAAGSVGVYGTGMTGVSVRPSGTQVASGDGGRKAGPAVAPPVPSTPTLSASVHQRSGLPSVGTLVAAAFPANGTTSHQASLTNAYGSVLLTSDAPCEKDWAIFRAVPAQMEYGVIAPDAHPLLHEGVHSQMEQSLVLDLAEPLHGSVVDDAGQPRYAVRVLPCIVDEVFGSIFVIDGGIITITDEQGRFVLRRMSATLPHYQHLALLLVHPGLEPKVVPVPVRGGPNARLPMVPVVMHPTTQVTLHLPVFPGPVTIWEEVPDLVAGSAVVRRPCEAQWNGDVSVRVGGGTLWWVSGGASNPVVRRLTESGPGHYSVPPPGFQQPLADFFSPLQSVDGTDLMVAFSSRHQQFAPPSGADPGTFTMVVGDSLNRPVGRAQVFAVTPTGPRSRAQSKFLGLTNAQGVISLEPVHDDGDLIVLGPDGSIAFLGDPQNSLPRLDARLSPPGRVLLGPAHRPSASASPVVALRFQLRFLQIPGVEVNSVRFASEATGWEVAGLAPGDYTVEVNGQTRAITVPASGFFTLD